MDNLEKTLLNQDYDGLLDRYFEAPKINQLRNFSEGESQKNWLSKTKKVLVTSTIAIAIPLGIDYGKPNTVLAQEVSATWAETITLTSILNGYQSISLGLEEIDIEGEINLRDSSIIFSETIAAVNLVGTIGDLDLVLNGQGVLSGEVGSENLSWTGNWLGSLGDEFISADDTGNFTLEGTQGYTTLDFQQLGFQGFGSWSGTSTAALSSEIGGNSISGWSGTGLGIGGSVSSITADIQTDFLASGNSIGSTLNIDGDAQFFSLRLDDSSIIQEGNYSSFLNKNNRNSTQPVDEPNPSAGIFFLLTLGIVSRARRFQR